MISHMIGTSDDECSSCSCSLFEFENDNVGIQIQERNQSLAWLDDVSTQPFEYDFQWIQREFEQTDTTRIQEDTSASSQIENPDISQCPNKFMIASYVLLGWQEFIITQRASLVCSYFRYLTSLSQWAFNLWKLVQCPNNMQSWLNVEFICETHPTGACVPAKRASRVGLFFKYLSSLAEWTFNLWRLVQCPNNKQAWLNLEFICENHPTGAWIPATHKCDQPCDFYRSDDCKEHTG